MSDLAPPLTLLHANVPTLGVPLFQSGMAEAEMMGETIPIDYGPILHQYDLRLRLLEGVVYELLARVVVLEVPWWTRLWHQLQAWWRS